MSEEETTVKAVGALGEALDRNRKQIREERARQILRTTKTHYRRSIETPHLRLAELEEKQAALLDFHPDSALSIMSVKDFNSEEFVDSNKKLAKDIHDTKEALEVYTTNYMFLFGEPPNIVL